MTDDGWQGLYLGILDALRSVTDRLDRIDARLARLKDGRA